MRNTKDPREETKPGLRILVVEDDEDSRDMMAQMLSGTGDHAIALAENGEDGLRYMRDDHYDLVVTDIGLPGMSGLEMVDQAVRAGLIDIARVVVCSATAWLPRGMLAQGALCIPKPVDPNKIRDALSSLCATMQAT